jgi:hypothetical protein
MIDVYATAGTFGDKHRLATDLAAAVMAVEQVPDIPMFRQNTAAFVHDLPAGALSNVEAKAITCGSRSSPTPVRSTAASSWPSWNG